MRSRHNLAGALALAWAMLALGPAWGQQAFRVTDIRPGGASSNPVEIFDWNGVAGFAANDGVNGNELWRSNGTAVGTVMVDDLSPGASSSNPHLIGRDKKVIGSALFFSADNGIQGRELFISMGTAATTGMIRDIWQGKTGSDPMQLTELNGNLYFIGANQGAGPELWRSDGTFAGTFMVIDIAPGPGAPASIFWQMVNLNGALMFNATDGFVGRELWISLGDDDNTEILLDIGADIIESFPQEFIVAGTTLYFSAKQTEEGRELWKSDGTAGGTKLIEDIFIGPRDSAVSESVSMGNRIFFQANDGSHGRELWVSDGSPTGTFMVRDIYAGSTSSRPNGIAVVGDTVIFAAQDGVNGQELWISDGTEAGTRMLGDINPGRGSSNPRDITSRDGLIFFSADDGVHGRELWVSDGTTAGTRMHQDIRTGPEGSDPTSIVFAGGHLFFAANDGVSGIELWAIDFVAGSMAGAPIPQSIVDLGGSVARIGWSNPFLPPLRQFVLAWDIYSAGFLDLPGDGKFFQPFPPNVSSADIDVGHSGGYHFWTASEYPPPPAAMAETNGSGDTHPVLITNSPISDIIFSGTPHKPRNVSALLTDAMGGVRLTWSPEMFGTFHYQIIVFQQNKGFIASLGPDGKNLWHFVPFGSSEFSGGYADFTLVPGGYVFFIRAVSWLSPFAESDYSTAFVNVP